MRRKDFAVWPLAVFLLAVWSLNTATIRRNPDPIADTQTDAISLKQKIEELKDGPRGAPAPSFRFYTKEDFKTRKPTETYAEESEPDPRRERVPSWGDPIPEDLSGYDDEREDWWVDDSGDFREEAGASETGQEETFWEEDW